MKRRIFIVIVAAIMLLPAISSFAAMMSDPISFSGSTSWRKNTVCSYSHNTNSFTMTVDLDSLSYIGSPSYSYVIFRVVDQDDLNCSVMQAVTTIANVTANPNSTSTTFGLRMYHPYFVLNQQSANGMVLYSGIYNGSIL